MATGGLIGSNRKQLANALYGMNKAADLQSARERAKAELEAAEAQRDAQALGSILGSVGSLLMDVNWSSVGSSGGNAATVSSFGGWGSF